MSNIVKMTVKDRHNIIKYGYNLPSTLQTYFPFFGQFLSIFEFTPEEEKEYGIKIADGEITCNCPDKLFDIDIDQHCRLSTASLTPRASSGHCSCTSTRLKATRNCRPARSCTVQSTRSAQQLSAT